MELISGQAKARDVLLKKLEKPVTENLLEEVVN
jgi:hypothetical protein